MEIVSLLPGGTEMVAKLGCLDSLVGRTFECDYPPGVSEVEPLVKPVVDQTIESHGDIDDQINQALEQEGTIYRVNEERLRELNPDLLITQDLCEVCAPSDREISRVLDEMDTPPEVLSMSPDSLAGIIDNMRELAEVTGTLDRFRQWHESVIDEFRRIDTIKMEESPGVVAVEWYDPIYVAGHWVPEQVKRAGGRPLLSEQNNPSHVVQPEALVEADPDVMVLMPCGMTAEQASSGKDELLSYDGFNELSAVRHDRVYAVDASAYFARPGPRVVEGTRLLAHLLSGPQISWSGSPDAFESISC